MDEENAIAVGVTYGLVQAPAEPYTNMWALAECIWAPPAVSDNFVERSDEGGGVKHRQFIGMTLCLPIDSSAVEEAAHGVEKLNLLFAEETARPVPFDHDERERFTANGTFSGQTVVIDRATGSEVIEWQTGDYQLSSAFARLANRLVRLAAQLRAKT